MKKLCLTLFLVSTEDFNVDEDNRDGKSFICNVCGSQADADANASQNIKTRAFDKEVNKITKDYRYNKYY